MTRRRSVLGWLAACSVVALLAAGGAQVAAISTNAEPTYAVYTAPVGEVGGSEILDITPDNKYAMVVGTNNSTERKLRAVTIDPASGFAKVSFDFASVVPASIPNPVVSSVAMQPSGYAIVTVREQGGIGATAPRPAGVAIFIRVDANGNMSLARSSALPVGIDPESIDVAPSGQYAVVANANYQASTNGSLSLIDLRNGPASAAVTNIPVSLAAYPDTYDTNDAGPEAVAVSPDSARAYVTLERNNVIAVLSVNAPSGGPLSAALAIEVLGRFNNIPLRPDGLALTPDSRYLVTANEGVGSERSNSVSLFQVNADPANPLDVITSVDVGAANALPEMVAVGDVGGVAKAFVTLPAVDSVAVFNIAPGTGAPLARQTVIPLNPGTAPFNNTADDPEGIAIARISSSLAYIVTANAGSTNISAIRAVSPSGPALQRRAWLPDSRK